MFQLMKLELKKNGIRTYVMVSIFTCITMLGFIYLFAYAPHIDPDPDLQIFAGYNNIISSFSILSSAVFAVLSATMYTRFIIDEYKGRRVALLFSYPIRRDKILLSKFMAVLLFTITAMVICNLLSFGIFSISESVYPIMDESLTMHIMLRVLKITFIMSCMAATIGIIATGVGFVKKSVPATIISSVLLSSLFCNIMFPFIGDMNKNDRTSLIFLSCSVFIGIIVLIILTKKVNHMEVE